MKNLILSGVLLLFVTLAFQSCTTESEIIIPMVEESAQTSTSETTNLRRTPCGNTGGEVIHHITNKADCIGYGLLWSRGKCWACY